MRISDTDLEAKIAFSERGNAEHVEQYGTKHKGLTDLLEVLYDLRDARAEKVDTRRTALEAAATKAASMLGPFGGLHPIPAAILALRDDTQKPDPMCTTCNGAGLVTEDDADGTRHSDIPCPSCGR